MGLNLSKMVEVGIAIPDNTDISAFLKNVAYIGDFEAADLVDDYSVPEDGIITISTMDGLNSVFKSDNEYYDDLSAILNQKNNTNPNKSNVNDIIVYQKQEGETDFGDSLTALIAKNANFGQVFISSRAKAEITATAEVAEANNRLFVAQTSDADVGSKTAGNVAETLMKSNYANTKLVNHLDTEGLACALGSVMANQRLGAVGDLYSEFSGITPQEYTETQMSNFDAQNVGYYTTVNAINGGGVEQYAKNILYGDVQVNGEITKRRYIRFTVDLLLKAKVLDFLAKKLTYQESSNNILEGELKSVLIECQSNDLIVQDNEDENGFYLKCMSIADIKKSYPTDYSNQVYHAEGWYRDALTGTKVVINLTVDPTDAEKSAIEM